MNVRKYSGDLVPFNPDSLLYSLKNSGANENESQSIFKVVEREMFDGISTKKLYEIAFAELKKLRHSFAARYSLKNAIKALGPEGYYFEKWMAKILQTQGYDAITSQTLQGSAVTHEIDVLASRKSELLICECKFRNDLDAKISVTTPMYFLSRFNDLKEHTFDFFGKKLQPTKGFLITNAFFTIDSIAFAEYYDIELISWNYPPKRNIKSLTDDFTMYPITCLTTLTDEEERLLLEKNCLLVKEIVRNPVLLDHFKFSEEKKIQVLEEAHDLCGDQE